MLRSLRAFFSDAFSSPDDEAGAAERHEHALRVATAALLVEMERADFRDDPAERDAVLRLLSNHFALDGAEARELIDRADGEADEAVSLHEFTSLLHENLSVEDKRRVVEMLWRVALADGEIDKYEDHLVRKVADLLYLSHTEVVRLRHLAQE